MDLDPKALEAAAKSAMEAHHGHGMWEKAGGHVTDYWRMIIGAGIRAYLAALAPAPAPDWPAQPQPAVQMHDNLDGTQTCKVCCHTSPTNPDWLTEARRKVAPAPAPAAVPPLRYAHANDVTERQRTGVWECGLAALGDAILVWVNEGDFWQHKVEQYPKRPKP